MPGRRGTPEEPEIGGMSLLDVLCCGLGAVILLVVLSGRLTERALERQVAALSERREAAESAFVEAQRLDDLAEQLDSSDARVAPAAAPPDDGRGGFRLFPHAEIASAVVLLDRSGSMGVDQPGRNWDRAIDLIEETLLGAPGLERFAVLGLTDDTAGESGTPLVEPNLGRWIEAGEHDPRTLVELIADAADGLRSIEPAGGSSHHAALARASAYLEPGPDAEPAADAMFILTDGLPNHGPEAGVASRDTTLHPTGDVRPASKRRRAEAATELLERRLAETGAATTVHVVALPWPDDLELPQFAIGLTRRTGGLVIHLPPLRGAEAAGPAAAVDRE